VSLDGYDDLVSASHLGGRCLGPVEGYEVVRVRIWPVRVPWTETPAANR
jgi:hypothetical protein